MKVEVKLDIIVLNQIIIRIDQFIRVMIITIELIINPIKIDKGLKENIAQIIILIMDEIDSKNIIRLQKNIIK
jgi:hypothetical protein